MRVFILEDCEIFRLSLTLILSQEPDIEVVGAVGSNNRNLCGQILASHCNVLLVGLRLRNRSALEVAKQINESNPNIPILALGFSTDAANVA
ncbi:MAG TPA: response regulator transcription factor, partial [Candidatus Obscuribacterales bacterium]|nr:response regulator transcription factor [Candidatus Obscuribacterales bacterium]